MTDKRFFEATIIHTFKTQENLAMKIKLTITTILCLILISCEKDNANKDDYGKGFEIYLTKALLFDNLETDYGSINLDTIALLKEPILRYDDLVKYDTLIHKLTLDISQDSLHLNGAGVYGRMFMVTIDRKPIYCGFIWSLISSIPCNWVFILEPHESLDSQADNEIVISFTSEQYIDPRLDRRIVDRLKVDGKIE